MAYFDYIAALDDSCAILSHAEPPFSSSPASLVRLHLRLSMVGVAGWHRNSEDWIPRKTEHHRNR